MRVLYSSVLVVCLLAPVVAQPQRPERHASFDVASVKPRSSSQDLPSLNVGPDSFLAMNYSLSRLITRAYGVTTQQVEGLPAWVQTERFDIRAKAQRVASRVEIFEMVRSLLEDRFKLRVRRESRVVDAYVLGIDRARYPGSGLHPISIDCVTNTLDPSSAAGAFPSDSPRPPCETMLRGRNKNTKKGVAVQLRYAGVTLSKFAEDLGGELGRPVRDQTGVDGIFDIDLNYPETLVTTPTQSGWAWLLDGKPDEATIRDLVRNQLGLTLSAGRAPVDFLIVDSIDRPDPD